MEVNLEELAKFLVKAKKQTYAGDGKEVPPQRPGFKELEFAERMWLYRDSYAGSYFAPGQEVVRYQNIPVWMMAYSGGMRKEFHGMKEYTKQAIAVLKKALLHIEVTRPFRGPNSFNDGDWEYEDASVGDLTDFQGVEHLFHNEKEVFRQQYIGGLIVAKAS